MSALLRGTVAKKDKMHCIRDIRSLNGHMESTINCLQRQWTLSRTPARSERKRCGQDWHTWQVAQYK